MSNLFTVAIPDSPTALLVTYGAGALIRVQSCPTSGGVYGDVDTIPIEAGVTTYPVYDPNGSSTDYYKIRYEAADGDPVGAYSTAFQPMASDQLYASLSEFKNFIRDSGVDEGDDAVMLNALAAGKRLIDIACNRSFNVAAATVSARYFTPTARLPLDPYIYGTSMYPPSWYRHATLPIDDVFDTTGMVVTFDTSGDGDYTSTITGYRPGPANAPAKSLPYTQLTFDGGIYPPVWTDSVKVEALWGWPAYPPTIIHANMIQASRLLKRRDAPFGVAGSPDMGNELRLLAKLDPDVALMVSAYKRTWGAV